MLLIDGVKYELWAPPSEDEFERVVKEHAEDIFGEQSLYLDIKHKLKSKAGTGTIPDGYIITFDDKPQLHIVEVELSGHSYDHIISQVTKIITCIIDPSTWNEIARTIRDEIMKDELIAIKAKKAIASGEVYEFLYDRISNLASLAIVIDKNREDVREGIRNITHREIKMIEFQTFRRLGAEAVHAHLFEPLYKAVTVIPKPTTEITPEDSFEVTLQPSYIESYCIYIPASKKHLFPTSNTTLELNSDIGVIEAKFSLDSFGIWLSTGLSKWFKAHAELEKGDKLRILLK
ncbi:hypothetical protein ACFLWS_05770 [Chloroflexota bacterium]